MEENLLINFIYIDYTDKEYSIFNLTQLH